MAVGDQNDMVARLTAALPRGWFPDLTNAPTLTAILNGIAYGLARIYSSLQFAHLQSRIATATGPWLDGIALDFFGSTLTRGAGQSDATLRTRITAALLQPKGTRAGMVDALLMLTGRMPRIFEPANATDCGGYGRQGMTAGTGLAYTNASSTLAAAGGYGSLALPYQAFVIAYRPGIAGQVSGGGYGLGLGYCNIALGAGGGGQWLSQATVQGAVTDANIYATIAAVEPIGGTAWTAISS